MDIWEDSRNKILLWSYVNGSLFYRSVVEQSSDTDSFLRHLGVLRVGEVVLAVITALLFIEGVVGIGIPEFHSAGQGFAITS